ncbi:MAG TPA: type II secretion system protein [Burkholderiales bacterium]|nr:type II secretion system protein [Burkholderiales bacterium]
MCTTSQPRKASGFTLIELIAFIAIIGISVAGVLLSFDTAARGSADPTVRKQALAIAESMLEEIQQMPYTYCDPDDPAATTAASAASCATVEAIGPEPGESRYNAITPFDNVNDYHGYNTAIEAPAGIKDLSGAPIGGGLALYNAAVSVSNAALAGVPAAEALLIQVTVTAPGNVTVALAAYRTRHAPRL